MMKIIVYGLLIAFCTLNSCSTSQQPIRELKQDINPATLLWYDTPANAWEEALPVGNGRLGAMVYGRTDREIIQLNEDTYWSGGPYRSAVEGGKNHLDEIQELIFQGKPIQAHKLFGRYMMGYPVEQQKYQPIGSVLIEFDHDKKADIRNYTRSLDLETGITKTEYTADGITYTREVFASAPDQVIVLHMTADKPDHLNFRLQLRGARNQAHSNYGTDYFKMDPVGDTALMVNGKSTDYLGIEGKLRYRTQIECITPDIDIKTENDFLTVKNAQEATFIIAAATNFVNYNDVSGDPVSKVKNHINQASKRKYPELKKKAIQDYQYLFNRVHINLPVTENSYLPTDKRLEKSSQLTDPSIAALCYNFGRYVLISSSRAGTQPANLQGIWNDNSNPAWDSKYTTNINTEMNYWPVESGNLSELSEPLHKMVRELMDQGSEVAQKHYGARGWVFHQNTDLWRVAAPMDGPCWGTFTTGGAWLTNQLFEHYLYHPDKEFLKEFYPVINGAVQFFMDFLTDDPNRKFLITCPSTSPENPPKGRGYEYFFDEVTGFWYFTTICYGSSIDSQIIRDLFNNYLQTCSVLGIRNKFTEKVSEAVLKLVPPRIGRNGSLQEWAEDYEQLEKEHRHFSHMYGLYPGNVISVKKTPELLDACKAVLEQRGDGAMGFSRAWKMALWARLYDGNRACSIFKKYLKEQCYPQLFAKCGEPLQIDGTMGVTAAISEMLVQSHDGFIHILPALPDEWDSGEFRGVCVRGGFEINMEWESKQLKHLEILSRYGKTCKINLGNRQLKAYRNGQMIRLDENKDGLLEFNTQKGAKYEFR